MQQYLTKVSTSPTEPVTLEDMLAWLKQEPGIDDDQITALITAARTYAEGYQRRSLVTEQWRLLRESFPLFSIRDGSGYMYAEEDAAEAMWEMPYGIWHPDMRRFAIELPRGPLVSLDGFTYLDPAGVSQTLATAAYQVVNGDDVNPRIFPADGTYWPASRFDPAGVQITWTAGYTADTLPKHTITAIKMLVASWYQDREGAQGIPQTVKTLLYQDAVVEF